MNVFIGTRDLALHAGDFIYGVQTEFKPPVRMDEKTLGIIDASIAGVVGPKGNHAARRDNHEGKVAALIHMKRELDNQKL